MTRLERCCRVLLRAYPAWYRRERAGEMLGTLTEAARTGQKWPSVHDARSLITGGLRVRGWVWCLSVLWAGIGAAGAAYFFILSTKPYTFSGPGLPAWSTEPQALLIAAGVGIVAWLLLPVPVMIAGFYRLSGPRPSSLLRKAAWTCTWLAGCGLMFLAIAWGDYPDQQICGRDGCVARIYGPAVVSWGELAICAAWIALAVAMTMITATPPPGQTMPAPAQNEKTVSDDLG